MLTLMSVWAEARAVWIEALRAVVLAVIEGDRVSVLALTPAILCCSSRRVPWMAAGGPWMATSRCTCSRSGGGGVWGKMLAMSMSGGN